MCCVFSNRKPSCMAAHLWDAPFADADTSMMTRGSCTKLWKEVMRVASTLAL